MSLLPWVILIPPSRVASPTNATKRSDYSDASRRRTATAQGEPRRQDPSAESLRQPDLRWTADNALYMCARLCRHSGRATALTRPSPMAPARAGTICFGATQAIPRRTAIGAFSASGCIPRRSTIARTSAPTAEVRRGAQAKGTSGRIQQGAVAGDAGCRREEHRVSEGSAASHLR